MASWVLYADGAIVRVPKGHQARRTYIIVEKPITGNNGNQVLKELQLIRDMGKGIKSHDT